MNQIIPTTTSVSGQEYRSISLNMSGEYVHYDGHTKFHILIGESGQISEKLKVTSPVQDIPIEVIRESNPIISLNDFKFHSGILELNKIIEKVKENFDDIFDRQVFFFEFKRKLDNLWKISKGREKEAVSLLEDAIKDLRSERLTKKKLKALEKATKIIRTKRVDKECLMEIDKILLDARIFTIPVIDELAELYENE